MKALMMAGGTGGHVFPALAVADELRRRGHEVVWLGVRGGMEADIARRNGYPLQEIEYRSPRRQSRILAALALLRAVFRACGVMRGVKPDLVVGMGGYASVPGGLASRLCGLRLVIHEQNSLAGKANRLLARFAHKVLVAYPGALRAPKDEALEVGNPVRDGFGSMRPPEERMAGRSGPMRLLVLGGSQGAKFLNENLPQAIGAMAPGSRPVVVHQCGRGNRGPVEAAYAAHQANADVREFIDDVAGEMERADLFAGRCGAATLAEIAAAGLGSMLFPYPYATEQHQSRNAQFFARAGAAVVIEETDFAPGLFAKELADIGRERALQMASAARGIAHANAAGKFADVCEGVVRAS